MYAMTGDYCKAAKGSFIRTVHKSVVREHSSALSTERAAHLHYHRKVFSILLLCFFLDGTVNHVSDIILEMRAAVCFACQSSK